MTLSLHRLRGDSWIRAALVAWSILLAVTFFRPLVRPVTGTMYPTYAAAGADFAAGERLYDNPHPHTDNFRYSPLVAAGFVPFSHLPPGVGGMLWRMLGAAVFVSGMAAWFRRVCPDATVGSFFLLAIPLSIASLHNGQANTLVSGLALWGTVLCANGRWSAAGVVVAGAVLFKIYPLAFALLLGLSAPLRFGIPLVLACAAGAVLPFAFASPEYVGDQYRYWIDNLGRDDRSQFALHAGLQDVQMLLRVIGLPVSLSDYRLAQMAAGGAVGLVVMWRLRRGTDRRELAVDVFSLYACWVLTFGPAVETSTYILMAPLMARELLDRAGQPRWAWRTAVVAACLFLTTRIVLALPRAIHQPVIATGIYPVATLLMTVAICGRIFAGTGRAAPEAERPVQVEWKAAA